MYENEERKNSNIFLKNRFKIRKMNSGQISSEIREIMKSDRENKLENNNNVNILDKVEYLQNNVNNLNIYNIRQRERSNSTRKRKTKKFSVFSNGKKGTALNNNNKDNISYEELEEEDELLNFRQKITKFFETSNRLFYVQLITSILSIITTIYYVICTYVNKLFQSLNYIDFFVCSLILIEHIISILLSHYFLSYILSIESILNFLIEIPPFFSIFCSNYHLSSGYRFINITRVFRFIKGYRIIEMLHKGEKSVNYQIFNIIAIILEIIFIWAGIIHMLDLSMVENDLLVTFGTLSRTNLLLRHKFHHYVYFIIVSLTTVGYGEIIPLTILGKFMIVFLVIVILLVVPEQTSELINLSNAQSIYERKKYLSIQGISFVVLLGDIELESLKGFTKEYFDKEQGSLFKHIVILMNKLPDRNLEIFLNKEENVKYITYLQGDPMNDNDLLRCDILKAKSCVIFTSKHCIDPHSSDHQSLLLAIFIKKLYYHLSMEIYIGNNRATDDSYTIQKANNILKKNHFRIFLQLNRPENSSHYFQTLQSTYKKNMLNDKLLVIEYFKMNLLSKSCMTPGIISLISNLVISSPISQDCFKNEAEWLREYTEGQKYEIVKLLIEGELLNYTFQSLAVEIYNKFHSILIGLEFGYKGNTIVKLNPINNNTIKDIIDSSFGLTNLEKNNNENIDIDEASLSFLPEERYNEIESEYNATINKKDLLDRKKVKIFLYIICDGKETRNEIQKLDFTMKKKKSSNNILETLPFNIFSKKKKGKKTISKTFKSDIYTKNISYYSSEVDEEEDDDNVQYLINPGKDGEIFCDIDEHFENYYISNESDKEYYYSNEIMRIGIKDRSDIKHHIIICGMNYEIIHLILPLRSKEIPENLLKWIVILASNIPQEINDILSKLKNIIFIQGDPLNPDNLYRANISKADIAVILNSKTNFDDNNNILGKEENELNINLNDSDKNKKENEIDSDAKTLFIYKSIKKLNSSIRIITELIKANNIEFLHSSRELKQLYKYSRVVKNIKKITSDNELDDEDKNGDDNLIYEYTPVYAAGEVFLPTLIDNITGQMQHKEFLYNILNLLLIGSKGPQKYWDQKLNQLYNNLRNSNLFLIQCESKDESFGDMFKRLLIKNKMISIGLYRKNNIENFYYVYTNPKKTTLIRETDFIFVLSCGDNIVSYIEKNLTNLSLKEELNLEKKISKKYSENYSSKANQNSISFKTNRIEGRLKSNIFNDNQPPDKNFHKSNSKLIRDDREKEKYAEINKLQNILDKSKEKLKNITNKSINTTKDINKYIIDGIKDEFAIYLNKKSDFHK